MHQMWRRHKAGHQQDLVPQDPPSVAQSNNNGASVNPLKMEESSHPLRLQATRSVLSSYDVPIRGGLLPGSKARERSRDRRLDPMGLTVLHEPDSSPSADIVFVHGLGGTSIQTWSRNRDPALFWPLEWLPFETGISSARISTFGYNANFAAISGSSTMLNISDFAKELLFRLRFATGTGERPLNIGSVPIIFVAHSMGGLVVKKAFILGQNDVHYKVIVEAMSAMVFLSTPHRGSDLAETLNKILSACLFGLSPKQYINELKGNSAALQEINDQFRNLAPSIDIVSFFETRQTSVGLSHVMVCQRDSSTLGYPGEISEPLDADHHQVCKFSSQQDPNYVSVRDILKHLLGKLQPVRAVQQGHTASEDLNFLGESLNGAEMPFDDQEYFAEKRLNGSCEWILEDEDVAAFLGNPDLTAQILWCSGKAGSGKSVMASFLINFVQGQGLDCAYYFFRFGDQTKNSITAFLFSIAFQIASLVPEYRRRLVKMFEEGLNVQKSAPRLNWSKLFVGALLKCNVQRPLFLVIDGLDETENSTLLLKFLSDLSGSTLPLRITLVSRKTQSLSTTLDRLGKFMRLTMVTIDNTDHDLQLYVEEEMSTMRGDADFKHGTMMRVLQKADGNFLWVHLVVNEILQCHTEDAVEDALNNVPQDLEPLYERIDAVLAQNLKPADQILGRSILQWAACARNPLTVSELRQALQPDYPRVLDLEHTIRQVCGEFVAVDKKGHVTMLHSSARDYLIANPALNFHIPVEKTHQLIFTKCMKVLISHGLKPRVEAEDKTFVTYAATSWPFHLEASASWSDQESLLLLARLFRSSQQVFNWIYLLSVTGRLRTLIHASKVMSHFIKRSDRLDSDRSPLTHKLQEKELVSLWANDLIRVVGKFGTQLILHPKIIFTLIPIFCPSHSVIHRQSARSGYASSMEIAGLTNSHWDDCLAKFAISGTSLPISITSLDRYFAVLTSEGSVRLFYSNTCEEARSFRHGERVICFNFNTGGGQLATYGYLKTKVWDTKTARLLFSVENPARAKAIAITFADDDETILTCSDDRLVRSCFISAPERGWQVVEDVLGAEAIEHNSPRKACFSPDGTLLAVAYRGHPLAVWSVQEDRPWLIGQCDRNEDRGRLTGYAEGRGTDAQTFCWNPMTGHILGTFNDGCVFKWLPGGQDLSVSPTRANNISCSADGKLFVSGSGNGTLRVWDFYHFSPIYQLNYPSMITDLCIDRNENRIYDIREKFCTIWEPSAMVRLLDVDEKASETMSTRESSTQVSIASEVAVEAQEPITTLSLSNQEDKYLTGNEEGVILVFDLSGQRLLELSQRFMTVEHASWSGDGRYIASVDLSRSIVVEEVDESKKIYNATTVFDATASDQVQQILMDTSGNNVLVVAKSSIHMYPIGAEGQATSYPQTSQHRWMMDPLDESVVIGFGYDNLLLHSWTDGRHIASIQLDLAKMSAGDANFLSMDKRRPSTTYPMAPTEIETIVTKVKFTIDNTTALIETSDITFQGRRKKAWMLIGTPSLIKEDGPASPIVPQSLDRALADAMEIALAFVSPDLTAMTASVPNTGRLSAHPLPRTPSFTGLPRTTTHCLAFISKDFWVCTFKLGAAGPGRVVRHFFLPRDWQNVELLELATMSRDGRLLCPRNGEVAVVSGGLAEEWVD